MSKKTKQNCYVYIWLRTKKKKKKKPYSLTLNSGVTFGK